MEIRATTPALKLHIPAFEELWYRQKLMADPATMCYNKGYDLPFDGYNRETGCIAFPPSEWAKWYDYFIGREPLRYYAYIVRESDGAFLGEVNLHREPDAPWYEMGIVLEAVHRGKGYAVPALRLLLRQAFEVLLADAVHNDFELSRAAAIRTHLAAGFTEYRRENSVVEVLITKEQYWH